MGLKITTSWIWPTSLINKEYRVLVLGLKGAGKKTMIKNLKLNEIETCQLGNGFKIISTKNANMTFTSWDIEKFNTDCFLSRTFYRNTRLILFVVDSTNEKHIEQNKKELHTILDKRLLQNVPLILMANKQDLSSAMSPQELAKHLGIYEIHDRTCLIRPSCAKHGDVLHGAISLILKHHETVKKETLRKNIQNN